MDKSHIVRGYGPFDKIIACLRHRIVFQKLKPYLPIQSCLDIGSGSYPTFLINLQAEHKYGLEQFVSKEMVDAAIINRIQLVEYDLSCSSKMPFEDVFFDVVTMTAVIEHIEPSKVAFVLSEVYRIMKSGGIFVLTTPAGWTDGLLRGLAYCRLISREEIDDHKNTFTQHKIQQNLARVGFQKIDTGTFECFMNLWAVARK